MIKEKTDMYEQLMESARKIGEIAEKEALFADEQSTISQNVVDTIIEEEIHRLIIPKEFGYPQIDFPTFSDFVKKVGYYNLSAAWLSYFFALHNSWAAMLPKEQMERIYEDGGLLADIFAPVGKVEKVDGGFILSGEWHYVSGINYCSWIAVGAMYQFEDQPYPERIALCLHVDDLEIEENWNSLGLRGSGSNSIRVKDLFVEDDMVLRFSKIIEHRKPENLEISEDYLYYNVPFFPAFYIGFPAMALGAAERALVEFKTQTKARVRFDGTNESQTAKAQRVIAESTLKYKAAEGLMKEYIHMLETDEGQYDMGEYNGIRVEIIKHCVDIAVRVLLSLGASALNKGNVVEMITRDLLALGAHITSLYEDGIDNYGKALFDIPTKNLG